MINGHNSPAFILANEGFDVWLGGIRGCKLSRKHQWLNPELDAEKYWNFSWQEMGEYDLPAFIEYIKRYNKNKIAYIGYSQGVVEGLYALAGGCNNDESKQEFYRDNISIMIFLAPNVKLYHTDSFFLKIGYYTLY